MLRFMMRAGDLVVFDNQRILHGRTAFASARHPRHLQGCYLTRDSVFSRAAIAVRRCDDRGKVAGLVPRPLEDYSELLRSLATSRS